MIKSPALLAACAFSLATMGSASACEFHSSGFGPPGSGWQSHYGSGQYSADGLNEWAQDQVNTSEPQNEAELFQRRPVPKPSFSNAAERASQKAQARLYLTPFQRQMGLKIIDDMMRKQASNSYR